MEQYQIFEGLADIYNQYRPSYPQEILLKIKDYHAQGHLPKESMRAIVDAGAGTGIFTRLLRSTFATDIAIIGIEPGNDMYHTAITTEPFAANLAYLQASAEQLPFRDATIQGVTVAQAVHWFDRPAFYTEVHRVLQSGGFVAIVQNNRIWQGNAFLIEYEEMLEHYNNAYSRYYRSFDVLEELNNAQGFSSQEKVEIGWQMQTDGEKFVNRCLSSSKVDAVVKNIGLQQMKDIIYNLIYKHFGDAPTFNIPYTTEVVLARK